MIKNQRINVMYLPALFVFAVFTIYPLISGFLISFTNWNGFHPKYDVVFLENYQSLFNDKYFLKTLINTIIFGVGSTIFQQIFGLLLALVLDTKMKGINCARAIIYLPVLVSPVIMGVMYYIILQYNGGPLNDIVVYVLKQQRVAWLSKDYLGIMWIVLINIFQFMGISMIIYLTGLQQISKTYFEAADMDGVGAFNKFRYITLPLLYPAIVTSVTINLIGGFKLFDIIKVLTNGGPGYSTNSISTYIGLVYQNQERAGYASAVGMFLFLMILTITLIMNYYFNKKEVEL